MFFSPFLVGLSARYEKYTIFSDEKEGLLIKLTHKKAKNRRSRPVFFSGNLL